MSLAIQNFIFFWRQMDLADTCYVHPADLSFYVRGDLAGLQLHLPPIPVSGNLKTADIFILMLNAGFGARDAKWENANPNELKLLRSCQLKNIHQNHEDNLYPFYDFNPAFRGHPGVAYWKGNEPKIQGGRRHQKLSAIVNEFSKKRGVNTDMQNAR